MSKFLETLVRSQNKSCSGKIKFPREDSAQRSAADMIRKKPGETFEHYKCDFCDGWHIGHRTSFDWIPESHKSFCLLLIQYECGNLLCKNIYLTSTVISNRIISHFPVVLTAKECFARCLKCKTESGTELVRQYVPLDSLPDDSPETAESLWASQLAVPIDMTGNLEQENQRLRSAVLNQCGDNLCWITDPAAAKILPEAEFLESCRRYHAQLQAENGVVSGCMTVAQLEARVLELETELKRWTDAAKEWWKAPPKPEK